MSSRVICVNDVALFKHHSVFSASEFNSMPDFSNKFEVWVLFHIWEMRCLLILYIFTSGSMWIHIKIWTSPRLAESPKNFWKVLTYCYTNATWLLLWYPSSTNCKSFSINWDEFGYCKLLINHINRGFKWDTFCDKETWLPIIPTLLISFADLRKSERPDISISFSRSDEL